MPAVSRIAVATESALAAIVIEKTPPQATAIESAFPVTRQGASASPLSVTLDGFELNRWAWNIGTAGWRFRTADKRSDNPVVPYRDGRVWTRKYFDERTIDLPMWVIGSEPDGTFVADKQTQLFANVRALRRAFTVQRRLKVLAFYDPYLAKNLEAEVEVVDTLDFESMAGATRAVFVATLIVPGVWFRDTVWQEDVSNPTARSDLDVWTVDVDTDAEIPDAQVTFSKSSGTCANPRLVALDGSWVQYSAEVAAGETVTIDCDDATAVSSEHGDVSGYVEWNPAFREPLLIGNGQQQFQFKASSPACDVRVAWKGMYW